MTIHKKITFVFLLLSLFFLNKTAYSKGEELRNMEAFHQYSYKKIKEANVFLSDNKSDSALNVLKKIDSESFTSSDSLYIYYLNTLAKVFLKEGSTDSALNYFIQALQLPLTSESEFLLSESYSKAAILSLQYRDSDKALQYAEKAIELLSKQKNLPAIADLYFELGFHNTNAGFFENALDYFIKSKYYFEQLHDTIRLASAYSYEGIVYHYIDEKDKAKKSFETALDLAQKVNSKEAHALIGAISNNLSALYQHAYGDMDKALEYLKLGMKYTSPDNKSYASLHANTGFYFLEEKIYDSAFLYFKKALAFDSLLKNRADYTEITKAVSHIFLSLNQLDSAYYYAGKSLEIAQKCNRLDKISQAYNLLSTIDTTVHDYKHALENYRKSVFYRDSLFRNNYLSKIEELKLQFDFEKKDSELNLLNEQNEIINRKMHTQMLVIILALLLIALTVISMISIYQSRKKIIRQNKEIIDQKEKITLQKEALEHKNEQLNDLVKTKDKFFSIISHDLRGPFHSLTGLLDLMLEDFNSFSDEEKYEYIQLMRNTSQNSYELLEMLLEWSRAQRGLIESAPEDTNVHDLVDSVIDLAEARATNKSQKLLNLVKHDLHVYIDQKLVKTIFNNLINNSIKFTPTGGTIEITAEEKAEEIVFCVSDNGIGMPQDKADKIFSIDSDFKRKGTSNEPGTGLGLIIVKEFINLMKGTIWAESEENFGTKIYFIIPKEA